jgi:hypothetical protein
MQTKLAMGMAVAATLALVATARAQDKQACVSAYEKAQQLRGEAKLRAARDQLLVCSRAECPALVRQDCSQWMGEVQNALPSVVIAARDGAGHDVLAVRVSIDGVVVTETLDGKPIPVDPGPHKVKYETAGSAPIEEQVLVREGERNRPLTVSFARGDARADNRREERRGGTPDDKPGPPIVAYTLIGVGVIALGSALVLDLVANSDATTLRDTCKPNCSQSAVDAVQTKYVAAGVSLGVGIVAVGVGTVLLLTRPRAKAGAWRVDATGVGVTF